MATKKGGWRTASREERETAYTQRTQRGVDYLNSEVPLFTPADGENCIRVVPPLEEDKLATGLWGMDFVQHFLGGKSHICPASLKKTAVCACCAAHRKYKDADEALAEEFKGSRRTLLYLLDFAKHKDGELKLWPAPASVVDDCVRAAKDRRSGKVRSLEDPEDGHVLFFDRLGTGRTTEYKNFSLEPEPFPLDDSLLDDIALFEDIIVPTTEAEIEELVASVLDGAEGKSEPAHRRRGREEPEEEDDRPARRARGKADEDRDPPPRDRGKAAEPEEDDRPRRGRGKDAEEEEDDRPARRGRGKDVEEEEEDRPARRERNKEPEEEDDRPRRGRDKDEDRDPPPRDRGRSKDEEADKGSRFSRKGGASVDDVRERARSAISGARGRGRD